MAIRIGVLGGIGPESTAEFYMELIKTLQRSGRVKKNTDFPQIVINSIPAPELIGDSVSEDDLKPYIEGIRQLERFGINFIAMACNIIHIFREKLQKETRAHIIDLRKEICSELARRCINSVVVLGMKSTISTGLYNFDGVECVIPDGNDVEILSSAVFNFNLGVDREKQKHAVKRIAEKYSRGGSCVVILGCTELALMMKDSDIPKIDTINLLAEAAARDFLDLRAIL